MSPPFWQYHRNIEINVTSNRHFAFVYLLGKLDYSLNGQWNNNRLFMAPGQPLIDKNIEVVKTQILLLQFF